MKIAIDARELRTSTGRYIERLIYYLQKIDHKNQYLILLKPKDMDSWHAINHNFNKVECPHKEFTLDEQIGFKKQLDSLNVDLVHFGMVQQPILYKGTTVTTMHDLTTLRFRNPAKNPIIFWLKQQIYAFVNIRAAKKSRFIITPTDFVKQDIVNFCKVDADKIIVTPESADKIIDTPETYFPMINKKFIMYVGRPTPHKNLDRLIDAFVLLNKKHPDLYLVLAGKKDFNYKLHEKRVNKQQIKNIVFTDFIPDTQLAWLYQNSQAYCFPSLSEGFGLPGLEAMHYGTPVVSSNATCLPEVYADAAHYFNPKDAEDICRAINDVLTNPDLKQELIKNGYKRVNQFSWQRMAEQTLKIYESALHN